MATTAKAGDDKEFISFDEAVKRLPEGGHVHTFRQAGPVLLGCDYDRESLLAAMKVAPNIEVPGPAAQAMKHGLAIRDDRGWLFIATLEAA